MEKGQTLKDAAWYYPQPYEKAAGIKDYIAFCKFQMSLGDELI
jgi:uncharacterized protein (DUF427 family)